ncbi:MAG: succinate dehydrogenase assembly factor 2 [Gammaproteobacteria bacterium]|nr:succinate dehydrogenase assembly factor 2 [Gammaproteobacteria bacterium]MBU1654513.1 succinate dehydrogenase assembly factor 2 [Gammaproteobacteria bacterium]MBU1962670.1 succinate dehydrogenase assembly factor 2 [Gammaproteobacteria bacterium]
MLQQELPGSDERDRLRWQCRRGMLELDLLLEAFLEEDYPGLPDQEKEAFSRFLGLEDPQLHDWLMGGGSPDDPAFAALICKLQTSLHNNPRATSSDT